MILAALILFGLAVTLGISLIVLGIRYRRSSLALAMGHVSFALLGIGLLWMQIESGPSYKLYNFAALLFVFALLGGMLLMALRMKNREHRTPPLMALVSLHAVMAIIALLLLILGYTRY